MTSRLPQIVAELPVAVRAALVASAQKIAQDAKDRVPVKSGRLRDGIHVEIGEEGVLVVAGDRDVFYGHMVEHGTTHSPPHPFLVPALEQNRGETVAAIDAAIRKAAR
jgi:HK97 gp10 family phage protein